MTRTSDKTSPLLAALGSGVLPGLGQFFNRQWLKGLAFLAVPAAFVLLEWSTSQWDRMDEGYRLDVNNYFARALQPVDDARSETLGALAGRSVVIASPTAQLVAPDRVAEGFDGGWVSVRSTVGAQGHGWLVSPEAASALVSSDAADPMEPTDDQVRALEGALAPPLADALAGHGDLGKPQVVRGADAGSLLSGGQVLKISATLTIDDSDYGTFVEYFPVGLAAEVVGPDFRQGQELHPVRDYGGYLSRGLWGLVTLGKLVIGSDYRGLSVETFNADLPWASADNSSLLLARGLIAAVLVLLYVVIWAFSILDAWASRRRFLETGEVQSLAAFARDLWDRAYVWILIAPAALLILFFTVIPFVYTFLCSFTNWTYKVYLLQQLVEWKGLTQYAEVFGEPAWLSIFFQVFGWTVLWAAASSFTVYVMGFLHALIVEHPLVRAKKVWRTILIVPWTFPALISLLAFRNIFDKDGLMNQFLLQTHLMKDVSNFLFAIGLEGRPDDIIYWFDPSYNANLAKAVALLVNLWLGSPYFMMLIIGIIATIPRDRYEAAMIDGANEWQRFRAITLPTVVNATVPAMIMTVTFNFNNFGAIYFLTGGGPAWLLEKLPDSLRSWTNSMPGQTDILISWIYKISFVPNSQMYNKAAVYTLFIFLILGLFAVINMRLTKAFDEAGEE